MRRLMLLAAIVLFAVSTGVLLRVATDDTSSKSVSQVQVHETPPPPPCPSVDDALKFGLTEKQAESLVRSCENTPASTPPPQSANPLPSDHASDSGSSKVPHISVMLRELIPPTKILFLSYGDSWVPFDAEDWRPLTAGDQGGWGYILPEDRQFFREYLDRLIVRFPEQRAALESARDIYTAEDADAPELRLSPIQKIDQIFRKAAAE